MLGGLNTQPYTVGSSTKEEPSLLLIIIYREMNNFSLYKNHKNYIYTNIEKLTNAHIILA